MAALKIATPWTGSTVRGVMPQVHGSLGAAEQDRAWAKIAPVLAHHRVAGRARIKLTGTASAAGPGAVQVNPRVCGAPTRVQAPGPDTKTAIDTAADRLDRQIRRLTTAWQRWDWPDPHRPTLATPSAGQITRRKTFGLHPAPPARPSPS